MDVVSRVSSWLPAGEDSVRPPTGLSAHPGEAPPPCPTASPGLEVVIVVGHPEVPEDDPLVIGGR